MSWSRTRGVALVLASTAAGAAGIRAEYTSSGPPMAMTAFDCRGGKFSAPQQDSDELQAWIEAETNKWVDATGDDEARPEGSAAANVLGQLVTPLSFLRGMAFEGHVFRWASFGPDGSMQAVALCEEGGGNLTVHGIVSRRALLKDKTALRGGGKALLSSLLQMVHRKDPTRSIALLGSPGDSFVGRVYREHGMTEVGRTEDDYAKLQLNITAPCTDFFSDAILCGKMSLANYTAIGWRMLPGSQHLKTTCAHIMPVKLYADQIGKALGLAH